MARDPNDALLSGSVGAVVDGTEVLRVRPKEFARFPPPGFPLPYRLFAANVAFSVTSVVVDGVWRDLKRFLVCAATLLASVGAGDGASVVLRVVVTS